MDDKHSAGTESSYKVTRKRFLAHLLGIGLMAGLGNLGVDAVPAIELKEAPLPRHSPFLKVKGTQLVRSGRLFRNVGANIPDLFVRFLHGDDRGATQTLKNAASIGIEAVRCFGSTWLWDDFQIFEHDRSRWLKAYDRTVAAAGDNGIGLVPSLLFNIGMIPHYVRKYRGKPNEHVVDLCTPGSLSNRLAVEYVTTIVERYRDDARVLFWEVGNEYNLAADLSAQWKQRPNNEIPTSNNIRDFLHQMAALIRRHDSNHAITSGNADMRPYAWHIRQAMLKHQHNADPFNYPMDWRDDTFAEYKEMMRWFNPPPIDVVSVHQYPPKVSGDVGSWLKPKFDLNRDQMLPYSRQVTDSMSCALYLGEFGGPVYQDGKEISSPFVLDVLRQVRASVVQLATIWSWEFYNGDPAQNPTTLSLTRTPQLAAIIRETNQGLSARSSA